MAETEPWSACRLHRNVDCFAAADPGTPVESIIRPLEEKIGDGVEDCILVDRFSWSSTPTDMAESVLVMFEYGSR